MTTAKRNDWFLFVRADSHFCWCFVIYIQKWKKYCKSCLIHYLLCINLNYGKKHFSHNQCCTFSCTIDNFKTLFVVHNTATCVYKTLLFLAFTFLQQESSMSPIFIIHRTNIVKQQNHNKDVLILIIDDFFSFYSLPSLPAFNLLGCSGF